MSPPIPITFHDIRRAAERLSPYLSPTPLRNYPSLDNAVGLRILLKHENHQPTNSFKVRNGFSALTRLAARGDLSGVIAASTGNHGQGVALAGRMLHIPVTICVPIGNNPEKNAAMRGFGAQLIEEGATYDDAIAVMTRVARERNLTVIHSTNNADVLAGAGTLTLEILEQAAAMGENVDAIIYAIGGGSQAVGGCVVTRELSPATRIYGVQAAQASAIHDSWRAGKIINHPSANTFAEGIATRTPYELTFDALRTALADFLLVTEQEMENAIRLLLSTTHNLAEGAGAAGLAGALKLAPSLKGKTLAVILSGGNLDQPTLRHILSDH